MDSLPFYFCQLLLFADSAATSLAIALWKHGYSSIVLIRVDRYGHLRRSIRTSAPVDTDVCVGRRGCLTTNINIRNETSFYHTKLSPAQPLLSANLQRRIHHRVAVGHEAQHQLAEPAALEPERTRLRWQGHHRSLYAAHSKN